MAQFHEVASFDSFNNVIASLKDVKGPIFAEFYGAHDSSGKSWCPDCVKGTFMMAICRLRMQSIIDSSVSGYYYF